MVKNFNQTPGMHSANWQEWLDLEFQSSLLIFLIQSAWASKQWCMGPDLQTRVITDDFSVQPDINVHSLPPSELEQQANKQLQYLLWQSVLKRAHLSQY